VTRCPSELELERHLRTPRHEVEAHAAACDRCRGRIAWAHEAEATFRREVFPATVERVVERTRPRPLRWLLVLAPASAAAAAAALLLVASPPADYVGAKGGGLALSVFANGPDGARPATDGAAVAADAGLRFEIHAARPCHLWLASLDATGQVSRLHPAAGGPVRVEGAVVLPGGALLDGRAGPERIYAVCTPEAVSFAEVERAVGTAGDPGEAAVRAARELPGLPRGTLVTTLLLEKRTASP
jgi:hypothetical protein